MRSANLNADAHTLRYYGRFLVTKKTGAVAFHQQLLVKARIHPAFHVSQLKLGVGGKPIEAELPTEFATERYELRAWWSSGFSHYNLAGLANGADPGTMAALID